MNDANAAPAPRRCGARWQGAAESVDCCPVNIPKGMQILLQGKADFLREVSQRMSEAEIKAVTGPLPGTT